jgi:hypothetical protein
MIITRLYLKGNVWLDLMGIHEIDWHPNAPHQLIIGTNGSGKTTLMREATPIPASKDDYLVGGCKHIEFTDKGSQYVLVSDFTQGVSHTFTRNGEPLNPGRTATVQKALILEHIGLDQKLIDVLLDVDVFTAMMPLERRSWLMRLSGSDMSYALGIWERLRTIHRDTKGVVKHLSKRLAEEVTRLPSLEDIARMEEETRTLVRELNVYLGSREPNAPDRLRAEQRYIQTVKDCEKLADLVLGNHRETPLRLRKVGVHDLSAHEIRLREHLSACKARCDRTQTEAGRIHQAVETLKMASAGSVQELEEKLKSLLKTHAEALEALPEDRRYLSSAEQLLRETEALQVDLNDILSTMPVNSDYRFSEEHVKANQAAFDLLQHQTEKLKNEAMRASHRLSHIEKMEESNCPRCGYLWKPGVNNGDVETIQQMLDENDARTKENKKQLDFLTKYFEEHQEYRDHVSRLNAIIRQHPALKPLWSSIGAVWDRGASPKAGIAAIVTWRYDLSRLMAAEAIGQQIQDIRTTMEQLQSTESAKSGQLESYLTELLGNLEEDLINVSMTQAELDEVLNYQRWVQFIQTKAGELTTQQAALDTSMHDLLRAIRNAELDKDIHANQILLATAETALNKARNAATLVADLQRSHDEAVKNQEAYAVLVKELSPTDGLIAEMMKGFVEVFTDQLNTIIAQVWTSDLKVLPCPEDAKAELTYEFPFSVKGKTQRDGDIKHGSASQVAMVNLAFKLVVSLYSGLEDHPLYLDEVAITFDELHRSNIIMFIKQFVETKRCSQLFMISHYFHMHGAFQGVEVLVTNTANILNLPQTYNQHVVIK